MKSAKLVDAAACAAISSEAALLADFRAFQRDPDASGIDPFLLFARIGDALHRRPAGKLNAPSPSPLLLGAPLRWYARTLEHWTTLLRTGRLRDLPSEDRTRILRHLRHNDLHAFGIKS